MSLNSTMSPASQATPSERLDGFTMIRRLARQGAVTSYLGADDTTAAAVLATVLNTRLNADSTQRFIRACSYGAHLRGHPGVVGLVACGVTERGRPYVVNDIREGGTLRDHLATTKRVDLPTTLLVGRLAGDALRAAHADGLIHGNVCPGSVLLDRHGRPALGAVGITTVLADGAGPGDMVRLLGIDHAAPETLGGAAPSAAGDVYSLASTLYQCASGRPPFKQAGHSAQEQLARKLAEEAPPLAARSGRKRTEESDADLAALGAVLAPALAREPGSRPTMAGFLEALHDLGKAAYGMWGRNQASTPALQNEVDRYLADGSNAAAPRPAPADDPDRIVRPIIIDEPVAHPRRGRDHVLVALSIDPERERRRRTLLWGGLGISAAALAAMALSRPAASGPVGALTARVTTVREVASAGQLPNGGSPDNIEPAATGLAPRIVGSGSVVLDDNGQPVVSVTVSVIPTTAPPGAPGASSVVVSVPVDAPTTRPAAPTIPVVATTRPTAPPPPSAVTAPPTAAPPVIAPPAPGPVTAPPAVTLAATTTTTTTTLPPTTTAPPPTTPAPPPPTTASPPPSDRPVINGISVNPAGDGSFSFSASAEKCAAWAWSISSDDGSVSQGTGLKYPNGNCFRSGPGYSTGVLPPGGYTVTLRIKSTTSGRESSASDRFSVG